MTHWTEYMDFGTVHSLIWLECRNGEGPMLETLTTIARDSDFGAVEIAPPKDPEVRKQVRDLLVSAAMQVVYLPILPIIVEGLEPGSADPDLRAETMRRMKVNLDEAVDYQATLAMIGPPKDPGEAERPAMIERFAEDLRELCDYASAKSGKRELFITLENFDRDVEKKRLIGPTVEAVALAKAVDRRNFGLTLDLSHLPLLNESPAHAISTAGEYLIHAHIGNCVKDDPESPLYGDFHPRFGHPEGVNDVPEVVEYLRQLFTNNYFDRTPRKIECTAHCFDGTAYYTWGRNTGRHYWQRQTDVYPCLESTTKRAIRMIHIVNWDSVGNTLWGVRRGQNSATRMPTDDPAAIDRSPTFDELFADFDVTLHECESLDDVEQHIEDADFLVLHKVNVPAEVLKRGKKLRLVQHLGMDYRGMPVETATAMGIPCAATPLINYRAVAEHNWALILNHFKRLPQHRIAMQNRAYVDEGWGFLPSLKISLMSDLTLGLLGFGEIARWIADYARVFHMRTIYWDIQRFPELEERYQVEYVEWETLWQESDALSVQIPIKPETHKIIGAKEFAMMKPRALFVNTARGKLVDEDALIDVLRERKIGGAALDVFYEEPLPADSPLHDLHEDLSYNVTITPHTAWQSHWTHIRDSLDIWDNVLAVLNGNPIKYQIGQP